MAKGKYVKWLEEDNLIRLQGWAMDGLTDDDIAENVGINRATLYDWKKRFPDINNALKKGKDSADRRVENALFKRATGYDEWEEKEELVAIPKVEYELKLKLALEEYDRENPESSHFDREMFIANFPRSRMMVTERKKKHIAPDTTAQIFWLKNRKPGDWRDKQQVEHSGGMNHNVNNLASLSVEELRQIADLNKK